jgi:4-amino-4-deoxy-L-arabinose transferase-like glycosyltransferase
LDWATNAEDYRVIVRRAEATTEWRLERSSVGRAATMRRTLQADVALATLVALVAFAVALAHIPYAGFNPDESRWLSRAHFLGDFFDPGSPTWDDGYTTRGQPPFGSYVTGLGLLLQGRDLVTNGPWNYEWLGTPGWQLNIIAGNMPDPADLVAARRTSAAIVALTAAAIYAIGLGLTGRLGALAGSLAFAVHPFTGYVGSIATADALLGLLVALAALAAMRFARRPTWGRAMLVGALLGLGGATKLSPLFVAAPLAALGAALLAVAAVRSRRLTLPRDRFSLALLTLPAVAATVFVLAYPYLWRNPVAGTERLFAFRVQEMREQSADWPEMDVPTRADALRRVGVNFSDRYSIAGGLASALGGWLGVDWRPPPVELLLAVAGSIVFGGLAVARGPRSPAMLALIVLAGQTAVTIGGMRSEFDRYHVPMMLLGTVAVGALVGAGAPWLRQMFAAGRRAVQPPTAPAGGGPRPIV